MKKLLPVALVACSLETDPGMETADSTFPQSFEIEELRNSFNEAFLPDEGQSLEEFSRDTQEMKSDEQIMSFGLYASGTCDEDWTAQWDQVADLRKAVACRTDVYRYFMNHEMNQSNWYDCSTEFTLLRQP